VSKFVPAPHVAMVAVPETEGVHWKTSSGDVPEFPQLPACVLVPLVVPPKVPPWAGITVGLLQAPDPASVVVVVEVVVGRFVVVVVGGLGNLKGSFYASLIVGMTDTFAQAFLPEA